MKDFEKVVDEETAEKDAVKMLKGEFTFSDFMKQINMIRQMGSLRSIFEKLPGMGELLEQIPPEALDDRELGKVEAMIQSMTKQERNFPDVLKDNTSRMARIARGSGRPVEEVESLYERFSQTRQMMGQLGQSGMFGGLPGLGGGGGGFPGMGGGRAARRKAKKGGGAPGLLGAMSAMGGAPQGDKPQLSVEEKLAAAEERKRKRRERKRSRKGRK